MLLTLSIDLITVEKQAEYTSVGDLLPKITDQFVALMELETVEQSFVSAAMDNLVAVMKALHGIAFRKRSGSSGG